MGKTAKKDFIKLSYVSNFGDKTYMNKLSDKYKTECLDDQVLSVRPSKVKHIYEKVTILRNYSCMEYAINGMRKLS